MIRGTMAATAIIALTAPTIAQAALPVVQPIPFGNARLRYMQGRATLELHGRNGIVQVTPLPMDHGCLSFGIVVVNQSDRAANIDVHDVTAMVGEQRGVVLTSSQLDGRAKTRTFWTSMAVGAFGGLAAGLAVAGNTSHYTVKTRSQHGSSISKVSYHAGGNAADSAVIGASTGAAVGSAQQQGERVRAVISEEILQLTTVDPGDSHAGRIVIDKFAGALPQTIALMVAWNGDIYTTKWQVAPDGTPAPAFSAPASTPVRQMEAPSPVNLAPAPIKAEPALFVAENRMVAPEKPIRPAAAERPKHHPNDDTVEVPM